MGIKFTKRRFERRNVQQVQTHLVHIRDRNDDSSVYPSSEDNFGSVGHIYQNIDEIGDIDSVDGTYYQYVDDNNSQRPSLDRRSTVTMTSRDSAFSERSANSKDSAQYHRNKADLTYCSSSGILDSSGNLKQPPRLPDRFGPKKCTKQDRHRSGSYDSNYERRHSAQCSNYNCSDSNGYSALPIVHGHSRPKEYEPYVIYQSATRVSRNGWKRSREAPTERVVFLLEAFQPLIVGCLNAMDIIPHLEFIEDTETFRVKHNESPRGAVTFLIEQLKESNEPGKWRAFLEALRAEGYEYIARLLLEETEADHTINKRILRLFTPELINRIDPEEFIDHLLADDVISDRDREEIQCEKRNRGDIAASLMLLERVPKKQEHWFETFVRVLEKCGLEDLIECFQVPEISRENSSKLSTHHLPGRLAVLNPDYITPTVDYVPWNVEQNTQIQRKCATESKEPGQTVPSRHDNEEEIDRLRSKREALLTEVSLRTDIRRLKLELDTLRKGDEEEYVKPDFPQNQQNGDPSTEPLSTPTSTTLFEKQSSTFTTKLNLDIAPTADSCVQTSEARKDDHLERIVNGIDNICEHLKDIKRETKGKNERNSSTTNRSTSLREVAIPEEYVMPIPHKCERISYLRSMDSAISMGYISCNTEQYV